MVIYMGQLYTSPWALIPHASIDLKKKKKKKGQLYTTNPMANSVQMPDNSELFVEIFYLSDGEESFFYFIFISVLACRIYAYGEAMVRTPYCRARGHSTSPGPFLFFH